jgi:predicted protein tyrosine phosphatase
LAETEYDPTVVTAPLTRASQQFIDTITKALVDLSGKDESTLRPDVAVEAANLTAAIIDADTRHTTSCGPTPKHSAPKYPLRSQALPLPKFVRPA